MPAASAISCNDVRNPVEAINAAAVCRISVRRVPESSTLPAWRPVSKALGLAMASYAPPPLNQIFVKGYQTARDKRAANGRDRAILERRAVPAVARDHLLDGSPNGRGE